MYMCIDLKSFFASVECVDRGFDPFKVDLVVADESRGTGAITPTLLIHTVIVGLKRELTSINKLL